jgi:hypothetical protein
MSKPKAYYLAFPEKNFEVMVKEGDETVIWTSHDMRPWLFIPDFERQGYDVEGFVHKWSTTPEGNHRPRWEPIERDSLGDGRRHQHVWATDADKAFHNRLADAYEADYVWPRIDREYEASRG